MLDLSPYFQQVAQDLLLIGNLLQVQSHPIVMLRVVHRGALAESTEALVVIGALARKWVINKAFLEKL